MHIVSFAGKKGITSFSLFKEIVLGLFGKIMSNIHPFIKYLLALTGYQIPQKVTPALLELRVKLATQSVSSNPDVNLKSDSDKC